MAGTNETVIEGIGALTYQRAIDIARNTEGTLDHNVKDYLDTAARDIWTRITRQPKAYILSKDEFAVFNYYIEIFEGHEWAEQAIERYWRNIGEINPHRQR